MYGFHRLMVPLTTYFCILYGTQVESFHDAFYPVQLGLEEWNENLIRLGTQDEEQQGNLACLRPNIYICEEPPYTIPAEATKMCNYRDVRYHEQVFRWVAGRGCLFFAPSWIYVEGRQSINLSAACLYEGMWAPCLEIPRDDGTCACFPFDPAFVEVANRVREAVVPTAQGRWESCFYTAVDCCSHYMPDTYSDSDKYCEATFDGWSCWPEAEINTVASQVCSEFAYTNSGPSCDHFSHKPCYENATWEPITDYTTCSITPRLLRRYYFHIAMLSFSIVSCIPAVCVFFFYKRLRVTRVALHRNLMIAIIIRNILVIVSRSEIYIDELTNSGDTVMSLHGVACRVLAVAERVAGNAVFVAMLIEGIYLHRMIAAVFRKKLNPKWLYGIGAVIAIVPVVAWSTVMGLYNDHSCWLIYTVDHIQWIIDAPRIGILLINTLLFFDVLRVLLTKIRNSENTHQLSTAKATLFLMPIFGTQFLLTAFRPNTNDCKGEQIYYYVAYTVEGLQGFIVAMLYCYVNKEVHMLVKATYIKTENAVVSRIRGDSVYQNNMSTNYSERRRTNSTDLPSPQEEQPKKQYATIKPKLHVAEIISIQGTEKLSDMLDPIYETIQNTVNERYDSLERSDNDSGFSPNRDSKVDDYYAYTNASSGSIDCQDWIRCISSPSSSVYENSLNDYETKYLERKFPNHPKMKEIKEKSGEKKSEENNGTNQYLKEKRSDDDDQPNNSNDIDFQSEDIDLDSIEKTEMLDEIMEYIVKAEAENSKVVLDPELLSPNRKEEDKVYFID